MDYKIRVGELPTFYSGQNLGDALFVGGKVAYVLDSRNIKALHYHDRTEIGVCIEGRGECHVEDRIYRYERGSVEIVPPGVPHLASSDEGERSLWKWMYFDAVRLMSTAGLVDPEGILSVTERARRFGGVFSREELGEIAHSIDALLDCVRTDDSLTELSLALAVGSLLVGASRREDVLNSVHDVQRTNGKIGDVIGFISSHLDSSELLSEDVLAERCSMSISNFRRVFKQQCAMSPKTFILRSRMAHAEYLLRKTDLSVLEISARVGYGEVSGFNRAFKRTFSLSPRAWRKSTRGD